MNKLVCPICGKIHDKTEEGLKDIQHCHDIVDNWHRESGRLKMEGLAKSLNLKINEFNEYLLKWNRLEK